MFFRIHKVDIQIVPVIVVSPVFEFRCPVPGPETVMGIKPVHLAPIGIESR